MKQSRLFLKMLVVSIIIFACVRPENSDIDLQTIPDKTELFADGFISTGLFERDIAISPEGDKIIYSLADVKQNRFCLVSVKKQNRKWSDPEMLNISGLYHDLEPFLANEGKRLFFVSNRPLPDDSSRTDYNIWYSDKKDDIWSEPVPLGEIINTGNNEFYPSLSSNGNLYFTTTKENGIGHEDIFVSEFVNGNYAEPVILDSTINTNLYEYNAYISPDEDLLIFSSFGRTDAHGGGDLYYSIKDASGNWTKAKNMGDIVNSDHLDFCPFIDWERNTFYFTSNRVKALNEGWSSIEDMKDFSGNSQNGLGDIYRIRLDVLKLD